MTPLLDGLDGCLLQLVGERAKLWQADPARRACAARRSRRRGYATELVEVSSPFRCVVIMALNGAVRRFIFVNSVR